MAVSAVVLDELPSTVQLAGAAAVLAGVVLATATRPRAVAAA
jgi:drug/metabolite transporter (DMT)-like permease